MIVGGGTYELLGTEAQRAIFLPCWTPGDPGFIAFPWERLSPPATPIPIGWMDLNASRERVVWRGASLASGVAARNLGLPDHEHDPSKIPGHVHVRDESGNEGHGILRQLDDARWWIAGVFWTDGRIYVDTRCEAQPALAREVVSAELAHSVDYFLPLSDDQKERIADLLHGGVDDSHTWWEIHDYGAEYYDLVGEAFMAAFTIAYSEIEPDQSAFTHKVSAAMRGPLIEIVGVAPVGATPPPSPSPWVQVGSGRRYHRPTCWVVRLASVFGRDVHPAPDGLSPCRVCRPQ